MPATVSVNDLTVVHRGSGGVSAAFPDVCKTPAPVGPVPLPYPNVARSADTANGSQSVKADGHPFMLKSSYFATSTGDEAGSLFGVASNKVKGRAYPKMYSFDVKVEGENVFRLTDIMLHNGGSPTNTPPATELQAPAMVSPGGGEAAREVEVTRLAFGRKEACCGDDVAMSVKTRNGRDGERVPVHFERVDDRFSLLDGVDAELAGDRAAPVWRVRRGAYARAARVRAKQTLLGGRRESGTSLEVKAPAPVAREVKRADRVVPKMKFEAATRTWRPSGGNWGWEVCYELELHPGELVVTRRIDFALKDGAAAPSARMRRKWRRQIESVWDGKWKLHRVKCKRGDACDCPVKDGCCVFQIRVRCIFGPGPGKKISLHGGANGTKASRKWWYSHNWWEAERLVSPRVRAHEFGHLIGMYDEYPAGAIDPTGAYAKVRESIMNAGAMTYKRHFREFHDWFTEKTKPIFGPSKLLRV